MTFNPAAYTFKFVPAEDESTDPEYVLLFEGVATKVSIQDCRSYGGGYSVNEESGEGDDYGVTFHQTCRALGAARDAAIKVHEMSRVSA